MGVRVAVWRGRCLPASVATQRTALGAVVLFAVWRVGRPTSSHFLPFSHLHLPTRRLWGQPGKGHVPTTTEFVLSTQPHTAELREN